MPQLFLMALCPGAVQVTRGVRVTATPLFVPEQSKLFDEETLRPRFLFAYWCALGHSEVVSTRLMCCFGLSILRMQLCLVGQ